MKKNGAIYLISSRTKLLKKCLNNLFKYWNYQFDYPVYVHYWNNIYSKKFINEVNKEISRNIYFHQIDYETPTNIKENEMYYNKTNLKYVRESFSKKRIGYLHMCRFATNLTSYGKKGCIIDKLKKYDYLMKIDDDSGFLKKIDFDLFEKLDKHPYVTAYTWNTFNYTHKETRINLWNFYNNYLKKFKYVPKFEPLANAIINKDEMTMHKLNWSSGNLNLFNIKFFLDKPWNEYLNELNNFGGDFKYRWGDIETIGLFAYTHFDKPILDLNLRNTGYYINKIDSSFSVMAPSPNSKYNLHNSIIFTVYHLIKFLFKKILIFFKNIFTRKKITNFRD